MKYSVLVVLVLCVACRPTDDWTKEQLEAFRSFREGDITSRRAAVVEVARSLPRTFNFDTLQVSLPVAPKVSYVELVEMLGPPANEFSLAERKSYIGIENREIGFSPEDLLVMLYDVDCVEAFRSTPGETDSCRMLDVLLLDDVVVSATVNRSYVKESVPWLMD